MLELPADQAATTRNRGDSASLPSANSTSTATTPEAIASTISMAGRASFAHGMLLETIAIAATRYGCRATIALPEGDAAQLDLASAAPPLHYRVRLEPDASLPPDPLASVSRRTIRAAMADAPAGVDCR